MTTDDLLEEAEEEIRLWGPTSPLSALLRRLVARCREAEDHDAAARLAKSWIDQIARLLELGAEEGIRKYAADVPRHHMAAFNRMVKHLVQSLRDTPGSAMLEPSTPKEALDAAT